MDDEWEDLMPDSGDNGITFGEAMSDAVLFASKVTAVAIAIMAIIGLVIYSVWKELAIFSFLTSH